LILFPLHLFAQDNSYDMNKSVTGIVTSNEGVYLILKKGLTQISQIDPYEEYYRAIYNDSTIINPNTELKTEFNLNIIPFISPTIKQHKIVFEEPLNLGFFVQINQLGGMNLTPYAKEYLDSLNQTNSP
jgi:hypothetical protein